MKQISLDNYKIDGPIRLDEGGSATIVTETGLTVFIMFENKTFTAHIESEDFGGYKNASLATVTRDGWVVSEG